MLHLGWLSCYFRLGAHSSFLLQVPAQHTHIPYFACAKHVSVDVKTPSSSLRRMHHRTGSLWNKVVSSGTLSLGEGGQQLGKRIERNGMAAVALTSSSQNSTTTTTTVVFGNRITQ